MTTLKDVIFNAFGSYFTNNDTYQENDHLNLKRGIWQRYQEMLAKETDDNTVPKITNLLPNAIVPKTVIDNFIPLREQHYGLAEKIYDSLAVRRKCLQYLPKLNRNRGTKQNYVFLFGLLGFNVEITEHYETGGWDTGFWDNGFWDSYLSISCYYDLVLTCRFPFVVTPEIEAQVARIIRYNHPIHARVGTITYVEYVVSRIISITPSSRDFGTVQVGNTASRTFTITNTGDGTLTVSSITFPFATYTADWNSGTISAGGSQVVNVTYTPTVAVTQNGTITVNSNATSGTNTVAVTGIGFKEIGARFDGVANYAQAPFSSGNTFAHTSAFTYSFYLRLGALSGSQIIMERWDATNSQTLLVQGSLFEFVKFSSSGVQHVRTSTTIFTDTLYKVDIISEGGSISQIKMYINDVLQTLTVLTNQTVSGTPNTLINFMRREGGSLFANGTLYYVRAYNKALTAGEVAEQDSTTIPATAVGNLVANWDIQEAQNSSTLVEQVASNNANLNGFTGGQLAVSRVDISNTPI